MANGERKGYRIMNYFVGEESFSYKRVSVEGNTSLTCPEEGAPLVILKSSPSEEKYRCVHCNRWYSEGSLREGINNKREKLLFEANHLERLLKKLD